MEGINAYTVLMLHCNGVDESTTFTDDSPSAHTFTATGTAEIDTDIKKFGTASGLFDGSSSCSIYSVDSEDFDLGSGDFTIDFQYRPTSLASTRAIISQWADAGAGGSIYLIQSGSTIKFYYNAGGGEVLISSTITLTQDTWQHICIMRSGNTLYFFKDGVLAGTGDMTGVTIQDSSLNFRISTYNGSAQAFAANIDEIRIQKGEAFFSTSGFTPPSSEYTVETPLEEQTETLEITDSIEVIDTSIIESDSLNITDEIEVIDTLIQESESLEITDSIIVTGTNTDAKYAYKIISINPLIFITDTNPVEIVKVDTTDPDDISWEVKTLSTISSAKDVVVDYSNIYIYVAGNTGQVIKIEIADLSNQTIIDLEDTDNIITIEHNSNHGITYVGTDNDIGELYTIDERETFTFDSDFNCLTPNEFTLDSNFNIISAFTLDSDFNCLSYQYFKIGSDFKCLSYQPANPITSIDDIIPINEEDYRVYIDDVELEDTDLVLSSINVIHSEGEESQASFKLTRKHDQLDTTLEGVSSEITNQNTVEIKCNGVTIFPHNGIGTGRISELDCRYELDSEYVIVSALSEEATDNFNNITLSVPSLNFRLSLYDVLVQNPKIYNPYIDPDNEDNPKKYKGIKVDLGTKITETLIKEYIYDTTGSIAEAIQNGTFNSLSNYTYFWSPTVTKIANFTLGAINTRRFFYIGTSLSPVSEDLWELDNASHWKQKINDDIETGDIDLPNPSPGYVVTEETTEPNQNPAGWKSGDAWGQQPSGDSTFGQEGYKTYKTYYYVGEAPFKEINVRNGIKITKPRLVDYPSSLYSIKNAGYNFINYAKTVADLEYENLKNINGTILPDTSCDLELTIDAYLYYNISLLTRINVDNTTEANIYNKSNGFPISVKSITISSSNRKVNISANNSKSIAELELINSQFPDEDADEYNTPETSVLIATKSNMRTNLTV